jgi:hypothetical protein
VEEQAEQCIPWDPIPHEYNRASDVSISNFGEYGVETTDGVACIVRSFLPEDSPDVAFRRYHRWRIFFPEPRAFRLRPLNDVIFGKWPEGLPITRPPASWSASGKRRVALWEITSSDYKELYVDPDDRDDEHHYVLLNHDMAYEVIALGYGVEDLGEYQQPIRR